MAALETVKGALEFTDNDPLTTLCYQARVSSLDGYGFASRADFFDKTSALFADDAVSHFEKYVNNMSFTVGAAERNDKVYNAIIETSDKYLRLLGDLKQIKAYIRTNELNPAQVEQLLTDLKNDKVEKNVLEGITGMKIPGDWQKVIAQSLEQVTDPKQRKALESYALKHYQGIIPQTGQPSEVDEKKHMAELLNMLPHTQLIMAGRKVDVAEIMGFEGEGAPQSAAATIQFLREVADGKVKETNFGAVTRQDMEGYHATPTLAMAAPPPTPEQKAEEKKRNNAPEMAPSFVKTS